MTSILAPGEDFPTVPEGAERKKKKRRLPGFFSAIRGREPEGGFRGTIGEGIANIIRVAGGGITAQEAVRQRETAQDQDRLRDALQSGDLKTAAGIDPDEAADAFAIDSAMDQRRRAGGLRAVMAARAATPEGGNFAETLQNITRNVPDLFTPEEIELAQQGGPDALAALLQDPSTSQSRGQRLRPIEAFNPETGRGAFFDPVTGEQILADFEPFAGERVRQGAERVRQGDEKIDQADFRDAVSATDKLLADSLSEAQVAVGLLENAARARQLLSEGIITGSLPERRLALSRTIETLTGRPIPESARTSEFRAIVGGFTAQAIQAFGAGTGLSDADREFAAAMAGGDLAGGAVALEKILGIVERESNRKINNFNALRQRLSTASPAVGQITPDVAAPQGSQTAPAGGESVIDARDFLRQRREARGQ